MPIYERMTEEMLREADKQMILQWDSPNNNFRVALDKLERLRDEGQDPDIYHVQRGPNKGGILLVNKASTKATPYNKR